MKVQKLTCDETILQNESNSELFIIYYYLFIIYSRTSLAKLQPNQRRQKFCKLMCFYKVENLRSSQVNYKLKNVIWSQKFWRLQAMWRMHGVM